MQACRALSELALGGTAVGTGLNAPAAFGDLAAEEISELLGYAFLSAPNKFHALTSKDQMVFAHGALKALAADLMKIANDVRWLRPALRHRRAHHPGQRARLVHHARQGQSHAVRGRHDGGRAGHGQ